MCLLISNSFRLLLISVGLFSFFDAEFFTHFQDKTDPLGERANALRCRIEQTSITIHVCGTQIDDGCLRSLVLGYSPGGQNVVQVSITHECSK